MRDPIAWFASHRVAANLLMLGIVAGGLLTLPTITREVFPDITPEILTVRVSYPGASPDEVETTVVTRIEDAVEGLLGVRRVTSTASEGSALVTAELFADADPARVLDDFKARIEAIPSFPEEAEKPVVELPLIRRQVINVAVSGTAEERTLKDEAERVRDEIAALDGITHVEVSGARRDEISIEVSESALRRHRLTFDEVAEAVRRFSLDLPGGTLKTSGGEIRLRTLGQARSGGEYEDLVLLSRADGARLLLGDVATVRDGFEESDRDTRFDGEPAVLVRVFRVGNQSALEISETVQRYVAEARDTMPAGVSLTTWDDDARVLRGRIDTLTRNARSGLLLVLLSLALFLKPRVAFWVSAGIPVAFLGALWLMPLTGATLNVVSLFAFILVLGILVDDSIVVGENVHTAQQQKRPDESLLEAAVRGTREVASPVTFGVLTTVVAFTPLLLVPGAAGTIWKQIPAVVIAALLFSLLKCYFVLPAHLGHAGRLRLPKRLNTALDAVPRRVGAGLERFIEGVYHPLLERVLAARWATLAVALASVLVTFAAVGGGWLRTTFFPPVEADRVVASFELPPGTPFERTVAAVRQVEEAVEVVREEFEAEGAVPVVEHVLSAAGQRINRGSRASFDGGQGSNVGSVEVSLVSAEARRVTAAEFARRLRETTGGVPDAVELTFSSELFSAGNPIDIELRGRDVEALGAVAGALRNELTGYPGVRDVRDSFREGKRELELRLRPGAETLGLSVADLGRQVRQAFHGEEVQRIARNGEDVKVMVRYPEAERRSLADVESLRIRTRAGDGVPLSVVADVARTYGPTSIRRADGARVVNVAADVDLSVTSAREVLGDIQDRFLPGLLAAYPGITYALEGEQREERESLRGLGRNSLFALLVIFTLLAIPLRSYAQPLVIMATIPLGAVGAISGHAMLGLPLSFSSVIGMVALAGVVVNDSIVLVDRANRLRCEGHDAGTAVREAGARRFRPIFLTSLTTSLGLLPLLLEQSPQAQFLIPMALSIAAGVLAATVVSLLVIPAAYLALEDLRGLVGGLGIRDAADRSELAGPSAAVMVAESGASWNCARSAGRRAGAAS
jgi:multidrug efflux pump subunit AcrB